MVSEKMPRVVRVWWLGVAKGVRVDEGRVAARARPFQRPLYLILWAGFFPVFCAGFNFVHPCELQRWAEGDMT